MTEGRNSNGEVKALLSTQKATPSVKFAGGTVPEHYTRGMAKPNSENEPGPGQYIDPLKFGRGPDGEVKAILSSDKAVRSTVWCRKSGPRASFNIGGLGNPGPGAYINPLKEGRDPSGQIKAVLSNQKGTTAVCFCRPKSSNDASRKLKFLEVARRADITPGPGQYINPLTEGRNSDGEVKALLSNQISTRSIKFGARPSSASNYRSMAKPNSENEPGPGQYIDPLKEGRNANGEVKAVLSTQVSTPGVIFARGTFEPPAKRGSQRPASAPGSRKALGADGPGLFNLQGDEKILSKYKNVTVARWGPPGR
jgi:hypothetical protein